MKVFEVLWIVFSFIEIIFLSHVLNSQIRKYVVVAKDLFKVWWTYSISRKVIQTFFHSMQIP